MSKNDFLRECLESFPGVSLDKFNLLWCTKCGNRQCERSGLNNSAFDKRVRTWREDLFTNVQRAEETDARFDNVRNKKFLPVQETPYSIKSVEDIAYVSLQSVQKVQEPTKFMAATESLPKTHEEIHVEPVLVSPTEVDQDPGTSSPVQRQPGVPDIANTPFQQGALIPGAPAQEETGGDEIGEGSTYILEDDE